MAIDYQNDPTIYDSKFQQQYLFGPSILVTPVKGNEELAKVYLPEGQWFDLFTDKLYEGKQTILTESPLEKMPLFAKAGSIVPMQKLVESTAENPGDTLYVHVYAGGTNNQFVYYEDDGESFDYSKGSFYKRTIAYQPESKLIEIEKKEGNSLSKFKVITMVWHGCKSSELTKLKVNGMTQVVNEQTIRFFTSHFKFADYGPFDYKKVEVVSFQNTDNKIVINW